VCVIGFCSKGNGSCRKDWEDVREREELQLILEGFLEEGAFGNGWIWTDRDLRGKRAFLVRAHEGCLGHMWHM
jgi:hypothetical protein